MFNKIWSVYQKHKELINYLIVGGIGTFVSILTFAVLINLGLSTVVANTISWFIVVVLMYILNRYFVFSEHATGFVGIVREILSFFAARVATLFIEDFIVWLGIDVMNFNAIIIKVIGQITVIVLNYVASKLFIFKKNK